MEGRRYASRTSYIKLAGCRGIFERVQMEISKDDTASPRAASDQTGLKLRQSHA